MDPYNGQTANHGSMSTNMTTNLNDLPTTSTLTTTGQPEFKTPQLVTQHPGGGKSVPPSKTKAKANIADEDYINRRNRNNVAVKKSREKSKEKTMTTVENIERLKTENNDLEQKVEVLSKELTVLRKVFMDHAKGFSGGDEIPDLKQLEQLLGHKLTEGPTVNKNASTSTKNGTP